MASEQLRAASTVIRQQRDAGSDDLTIAQRRAAMEAMQSSLPMPDNASREDIAIAGVDACWIDTPGAATHRVILYLHGGGYMMGSLDTHQVLMARLSQQCQCRVLGVDYRLAPETVFPGALDDAVSAYRWLLEGGYSSAGIMLAGDSAGGGLSVATLLQLRDLGIALPAGAILYSPWTDLTGSGDSMTTRAEADPMIAADGINGIGPLYGGDAELNSPLISPQFADLTGLPPLLIQVGDAEILLNDATRLAANAARDGVTHELQIWDEAFHVFQALPHLPESVEALANSGDFFARHVKN